LCLEDGLTNPFVPIPAELLWELGSIKTARYPKSRPRPSRISRTMWRPGKSAASGVEAVGTPNPRTSFVSNRHVAGLSCTTSPPDLGIVNWSVVRWTLPRAIGCGCDAEAKRRRTTRSAIRLLLTEGLDHRGEHPARRRARAKVSASLHGREPPTGWWAPCARHRPTNAQSEETRVGGRTRVSRRGPLLEHR